MRIVGLFNGPVKGHAVGILINSTLLRRSVVAFLVLAGLASCSVWWLTRDRLPVEIRIATAGDKDMYHTFGEIFGPELARLIHRPVQLVPSTGSVRNRELLASSQAELALVQGGMFPMDSMVPIAPVYEEMVLVLARKGSGIRRIQDLAGRRVSLGPDSGSRRNALRVLEHFKIDVDSLHDTEKHISSLLEQDEMEAGILVAGLNNPEIIRLMALGTFELLPIPEAAGLSLHHAFFKASTLPAGTFPGEMPEPRASLPTLSTVALLVVPATNASPKLIEKALETLYQPGMRHRLPVLMDKQEAADWHLLELHPAANAFFNPYEGIEVLANLVESMAGVKELVFALGAVIFLLWERWRRLKEKEKNRELSIQKERLDTFLDETLEIEREVLLTEDIQRLRQLSEEAIRIKLRALDEFTHETLRGDLQFAIFLTQCSGLASNIEARIRSCPAASLEQEPPSEP